MSIPRGTTPINYFDVDIDLSDAAVVYLTYQQGGRTIIEKTKDDLTFEGNEGEGYVVSVGLSQQDTLAFDQRQRVEIQIRARYPGGKAVKSDIMPTTADRVLKEGVI